MVNINTGEHVGIARYTFVKTTRVEAFRTFCVVWREGTDLICALREAIWELKLDSSQPNQRAIVRKDGPATKAPATASPIANNAPKHWDAEDSVSMVTFTFP
jgi:hypothetical protein